MKFELSNGQVISARQAWHDAFTTDIRAIDYVELANGAGVQFTVKGSDNCTMNHCDKGKIQQVIHGIRQENKIAWAWGMYAYAPNGTQNLNSLMNILLPFALNSVRTEKFNSFTSPECGRLAFAAIHDASIEAWTDARYRRKRSEMAAFCNCTVEKYQKQWMPIFFNMKDRLRDLGAIALPPVASVVWMLVDKAKGELNSDLLCSNLNLSLDPVLPDAI